MRPDVSDLADVSYARVPEFMREADEPLGWPLLRFLSLPADVAGPALEMLDRFEYVPPDMGGPDVGSSDLVDPAGADAAWLPWLAFLVGARLAPDATDAERRATVAGATTGVAAGTRLSIVAAAQQVLTGGRYADVRDHPGGDPWTLSITTRVDETPGGSASVLAAVRAARVVPAGHDVAHTFYSASWATVESTYPTWNAIEAAATWNTIEGTP